MAVAALRQPGFPGLWLSNGVNQTAFFLRSAIQGWLVLQLTNSSTWVGLVNGLPIFVSAPITFFAGPIGDRYDPRQLLIWARAASAVFLFMTAYLITAGVVNVYHVLVLAVGINTAYYLSFPASQTFVITLVGAERVLAANALINGVAFGFNIVAPPLAGLLAAKLGLDSAYYAMGLAFLVATIAAWFTPSHKPAAGAQGQSMLGEVLAGMAYVRKRPGLAWIFYLALLSIVGAPFNTILPALARDGLGLGADGFGLLAGSQGIGSLISSYLMIRHGSVRRKGVSMLIGATIWSFGMVLMGFSQELWQAVLVGVLMGLSPPLWLNSIQTVLLTAVPAEMRSRMAALFALSFQTLLLGFFLGGITADIFGPADALKLLGIVGLLLHIPPLLSRDFRNIG